MSEREDPLVIRHLDYLGPMAQKGGWRPEPTLPEIAFAGRSNVGKSSLLNRLMRRKSFARVSNTPGRTREIHFFNVNKLFILADLPGYGYAKISKARKAEWRPLIEGYLADSPVLRGVVQLFDVRHDPTGDDLIMLDFLADLGVPTIMAATKIDKLPTAQVAERVDAVAKRLGLDPEQIVPFSARTGDGRDELALALMELLSMPDWRSDDEDTEGSDVLDRPDRVPEADGGADHNTMAP